MNRTIRIALGTGLAAVLLGAQDAAARHCGPGFGIGTSTFTMFKAGGYGLDDLDSAHAFEGGLFVGVESGVEISRHVDFGVSVDWFHRSRANTDVLLIDSAYDLPIQGHFDVDGTSTDLIPLGAGLRLRFPVADDRFAPFVSGQLTWDVLRLSSHDVEMVGGTPVVTETTDWFTGPGGTIALGVEARLDPRVGFVFEAGAHGSEPAKDIVVDGTPIRAHVVADGEFARFGVRLGF